MLRRRKPRLIGAPAWPSAVPGAVGGSFLNVLVFFESITDQDLQLSVLLFCMLLLTLLLEQSLLKLILRNLKLNLYTFLILIKFLF